MPYLGTSHNNSVVHISRSAMNILLGNGNEYIYPQWWCKLLVGSDISV